MRERSHAQDSSGAGARLVVGVQRGHEACPSGSLGAEAPFTQLLRLCLFCVCKMLANTQRLPKHSRFCFLNQSVVWGML